MKAPPLPVPSSMTFDDKPTQQQSTTFSNNIITTNNNNNLREIDYSEYEWMEHIDEFDKEVLKVLEEEEALYEAYFFECFDLIECDDDIDNYQYYDDSADVYSNNNYIINCYTNNYLPNNAYENCLHPDVKCDEYFLDQFSVLNVSTLNPEAPEFQPKFS